ncbi:hypothetical protein LCGC14_2270730 [marine sediment metagenome]|uniref:Uncharacterized protein n=1 Tax=marine sediment metagenome TaxID=412755 RepID=A0A0F9FS55_9ZZZZ
MVSLLAGLGSKVTQYSKYCIKALIGIKGNNGSSVVNFIIMDWIGDHYKELREYGINRHGFEERKAMDKHSESIGPKE